MNIYEKYGRAIDKFEILQDGYIGLLSAIKDAQAGKIKLDQIKITNNSWEVLEK